MFVRIGQLGYESGAHTYIGQTGVALWIMTDWVYVIELNVGLSRYFVAPKESVSGTLVVVEANMLTVKLTNFAALSEATHSHRAYQRLKPGLLHRFWMTKYAKRSDSVFESFVRRIGNECRESRQAIEMKGMEGDFARELPCREAGRIQ